MNKLIVAVVLLAVSANAQVSTDTNELQFFHYPTPHNSHEIRYNDADSLHSSFRTATRTSIIIDGFLSNSSTPMSQQTKDVILDRSASENVIILDWGRLSGSGLSLGNLIETGAAYIKVLNNVGPVGQRLAEFCNFLRTEKNIGFGDIHIIGHSLGAHIAGATGVNVIRNYGGLIGRATGLDPAGPFFSLQVDKDKRLHKGDAAYVDIYHSNRGTLGDGDHQTGDINVYINGGDNQPGCEDADNAGFKGYCSHSFSWRFFNAASIGFGNNLACPCSGLPCQGKNEITCATPTKLGLDVPYSASGALHIITGPL